MSRSRSGMSRGRLTLASTRPLGSSSAKPGLRPVLGARVLAEFGDDPHRYASAKARKNYAGTSPITRASGKKKATLARFVRNDRLIDAEGAATAMGGGHPEATWPARYSHGSRHDLRRGV